MERYQLILGLLTIGVGVLGILQTRQRDMQRDAAKRASEERANAASMVEKVWSDVRRALDGVLMLEQWVKAWERYEPKRRDEIISRLEKLEYIVERRESVRRRVDEEK